MLGLATAAICFVAALGSVLAVTHLREGGPARFGLHAQTRLGMLHGLAGAGGLALLALAVRRSPSAARIATGVGQFGHFAL